MRGNGKKTEMNTDRYVGTQKVLAKPESITIREQQNVRKSLESKRVNARLSQKNKEIVDTSKLSTFETKVGGYIQSSSS